MSHVPIKRTNFLKICQNSVSKNDLHRESKSYRNKLSTIIKESKRKYYNDYFRSNLKNIKNKWKGIKSIISLKCKDFELKL